MQHLKIVVIGGGAAGVFGAIASAHTNHDAEITLLEKSHRLLSKVKISGGGRCNVTNACFENHLLVKNYPRGFKELKEAFNIFSVNHTIEWFEKRGVKLKAEPDGRMFPVSDDSQSIIDCMIKEARVNGVKLLTEFGVKEIEVRENTKERFLIKLRAGESLVADRILIATGGNPNDDSYNWIKQLGHKILKPVPSLFTFNVPNSRLNGLQGLSVKNATVKISGSNFEEQGPLLITHWGFSGPCILRLSAWGARYLSDLNYQFNISIKWVPEYNEDQLREIFIQHKEENPKKLVVSNALFEIPKRLWERLSTLSGIDEEMRWLDLPKKNMNKLIEELLRSNFTIKGKTTFKEEFVTCGGISLAEVNFQTMESKLCRGLFFAGEVLDIDGITGGFNFQAAWTTGYIAGKAMAEITATLAH